MANALSIPHPATASTTTGAVERTAGIPWYLWSAAAGVTSAIIGGHWDISWHRSIGRDTFLTPAHIAIYLCGVLGGASFAWTIFSTTFGQDKDSRDSSVRIWGFRGPLGAFIGAWGGIAMLTSAPFDDWWHNAYGLDVKIVSPPHVLLILGAFAVEMGALVMTLGLMNRREPRQRRSLEWLFLYIGALLVTNMLLLVMEFISRPLMHSATMYRAVALTVPFALAGLSRASGHKWACTIVTAIYSVFLIAFQWILPLFPAEPKLGPVFQQVTQFIPGGFPLLLIVPAVALDLFFTRTKDWNRWLQGAAAGVIFLAVFIAVQWPFGDFLQSPAARNWVFGSHYLPYAARPQSAMALYRFVPIEPTAAAFWRVMAIAFGASMLMSRLGLAWGGWMEKIKR